MLRRRTAVVIRAVVGYRGVVSDARQVADNPAEYGVPDCLEHHISLRRSVHRQPARPRGHECRAAVDSATRRQFPVERAVLRHAQPAARTYRHTDTRRTGLYLYSICRRSPQTRRMAVRTLFRVDSFRDLSQRICLSA